MTCKCGRYVWDPHWVLQANEPRGAWLQPCGPVPRREPDILCEGYCQYCGTHLLDEGHTEEMVPAADYRELRRLVNVVVSSATPLEEDVAADALIAWLDAHPEEEPA